MIQADFLAIRDALATLASDHDASGQQRPRVDEIFTPKQHANALDPNTPIVVGARGTGKSFWAGVLEQEDTRKVAAIAYPNLGLKKLIVKPGYNGIDPLTQGIIKKFVPPGKENELAFDFWSAVILQAAKSTYNPGSEVMTIGKTMQQYADPEDWQKEIRLLDEKLTASSHTLLIIFDALDTISKDWKRSSLLIDALFEAIWSLRARRSIRAKIFIRPEQLNDETLNFIELPKLQSGRVELDWTQVDLYGLLFWHLAMNPGIKSSFDKLTKQIGAPIPDNLEVNRNDWSLIINADLQNSAMTLMAGAYMGNSKTKGGTYNWPYKHLSDASGKVTPRSFIKLFVEAAKFRQPPANQAISAEGIRHGLREASKVRVDQLVIEYKWVKRALAPLAGLIVPCPPKELFGRWEETNTIPLILKAASDPETGFLPPFPPSHENHMELLATAMTQIGLLSYRSNGRIDIPDLFRVAAQMLKKGGTPPIQRT